MTDEQAAPRPCFGVLSAIAPLNMGCFSFVWNEVSDMVIHLDRGILALLVLCAPPLLGTVLAAIALFRRERWRWLAMTGLVVNAILLALLILAMAGWLVIRDTKVV
jgi:hypothetical protein